MLVTVLEKMKCSGWVTSKKLRCYAGLCSFFFFIILAIFWKALFDFIMKTQIQLNPQSILYKIWVKNPIPIYLEIYLFNFTNAKEFERNKSVIPNFEEVGPFYFEETREKVNVSWDNLEETVVFNQTKTWRFIPEPSEDFSVNITNINPIASTIAYMSRLWESKLQRKIANALLNVHEPLIVTATARSWIFDGIPDPFLDMMEALRKITEIPIPYNRFGWFYERNGSSTFDGIFTVKTGRFNSNDLGKMIAWNYVNKTDFYTDDCGLVRGSMGDIFPPLKPFQDTVSVFATDICSYVSLKFAKSMAFGGVTAYEYVGDESVFDNGTSFPENGCFYVGESCPSDSYFSEKITGMTPEESKHKFSLKIEPSTGIPLAVEASFQINFFMESYSWCDEFREMPKIHIPMLWFKQAVKMPTSYLVALGVTLFIQNYGGYLIFGCTFTVLLFYCYYNRNKFFLKNKEK